MELQGNILKSKNYRLSHLVLIGVLLLSAYLPTLNYPFVFDDERHIHENHYITRLAYYLIPLSGSREAGLIDDIPGSGDIQYNTYRQRFVSYFTFALNYFLGEYDVVGYRLFNIALHFFNTLLIYYLFQLLFRLALRRDGEAGYWPLLGALIFALHPLQTQSVTYVVQRMTMLAATFSLLSLIAYIKYRSGRVSRPWLCYGATIFATLLAIKSKENGYILPVIIGLTEFWFFSASLRERLRLLLPLAATLLVVPLTLMDFGLADMSLAERISLYARAGELSRWEYLLTQFNVIVTYLRLLLLPIGQSLDYDYPTYHTIFAFGSFSKFLLLLGLALSAFYFRRLAAKHTTLSLSGYAVLFFFLTLSVESSLIPIHDVMVEHRLYLPLAGATLALLGVLPALLELIYRKVDVRSAKRALTVVAACYLAMLLLLTLSRNFEYQSKYTIWRDVVSKAPEKPRGLYNLALAAEVRAWEIYEDRNMERTKRKQTFNEMIDTALKNYHRSLELEPGRADANFRLGFIYYTINQNEKALPHLAQAFTAIPDDIYMRYYYGSALLRAEKYREAREHFEFVVRREAEHVGARLALAQLLIKTGEARAALEHYLKALELDPENIQIHLDLAQLYTQLGEKREAQFHSDQFQRKKSGAALRR